MAMQLVVTAHTGVSEVYAIISVYTQDGPSEPRGKIYSSRRTLLTSGMGEHAGDLAELLGECLFNEAGLMPRE